MAQNQALDNPHYQANNSYHSHDMSMTRKFSSSVGQLLPVYQDLLYPGDKVRFSTEMFSRTEEITSPALVEINEHVRWFFVPLQQLYQFSPSTLFAIDDYHTSFATGQPIADLPFFDFKAALDAQTFSYNFNTLADVLGDATEATNRVDPYQIPNYYNLCRLGELLGYSNIAIEDPRTLFDNNAGLHINVNFMFAAAYQKIWYDHFRISDRTPNDPNAYNVDRFYDSMNVNRNDRLFELHYVPYAKDYFTSMKVSPLINGSSIGMVASHDLASVNQWLVDSVGIYGVPNINNNLNVAGNRESTATGAMSNQAVSQALRKTLNTANLRSMFAVEKLSEITREAAKHYDAQVLAHFGVNVPLGVSGECFKLGSDDAMVQIQDVTSFAATSDATLGELAGKGIAYNDNKEQHEFSAPCHGILMAVFYALPSVDYRSFGIERLNTYRKREDFFVKSLENLGQQPVFHYEIAYNSSDGYTDIMGWNWRYMESKVKYNVLNGNFNTTSKNWSSAKLDQSVKDFTMSPSFYYCDPRFLDTIMAVSYQPKSTDAFEPFGRDPLKHMFKFHVYKSSQMSPFSLPSL